MFQGKPLLRIFGKTIDGETVCVFYNKFMPYSYLKADEEDFPRIADDLKKRFNVNTEVVKRTIPVGFQQPINILKITGKDPSQTPEIREYARKYGIPYEADVLFKYRFMADSNLKGMGWIEVKGKLTPPTKTVKCKSFEAESITPIQMTKNAPLKYLAFDLEVLPKEEDRFGIPEKDPIIIISLAFYPEYKKYKEMVILAKPITTDKDVIGCSDEKEMLKKFLEILHDYDPDILIGYNINNFDLPYLLKRLEVLRLSKDFGRSEKQVAVKKLQYSYISIISGRVVVDPYEIIKRDPWVKFKRYTLAAVAKEMLDIDKLDMGGMPEMRELWNGNRDKIKKFVDYARRDSELALKLVTERGLLDRFFELAKISGLLLQDSLGGQAQRHENKLLKEFHKRDYIMPCKPDQQEVSTRMKERATVGLKGALVLEPEVGLHNNVLVLDFTSLYPSLIRRFNICPTTFLTNNENIGHIVSPYETKFVKQNIRKGILPKILDELITTRADVRKQVRLTQNIEERKILNAKQLALKDMANSLYGYTGYLRSRLYVMQIANTITAFGRDTITRTKELIENKFNVKVLYADTDSVFIDTDIENLDELQKFGNQISEAVTEDLGLELKFEKIFKTFLISSKKRYAGWAFEKERDKWVDKLDMKGIETVRRDWCELTSDTMLDVLNIVLKEQDITKACKHVRKVINDLTESKVDLDKLTIVKGITKSIDAYDGIQPHVETAKKIMKRDPTKGSMVGQRIGFVIIRGNQLLSKRAEDPDYVKEKKLQIDPQYYISNQMLPPLERIFEACGITASELLEGVRQQSLTDILFEKTVSPEKTVLEGFDSVVCKKCDWSFRRPTLNGVCPKCSSKIYFAMNGSIGKTIGFK
jgi:DNA polymerase I